MAIDPFFGSLLGAGSSILGGLLQSGGTQSQNQTQIALSREAMQKNQEMAREQMQFQERMSSTAYQRSMADMKSAGLNPILAYQKGGASTPGGAMGSMQAAQVENEAEGLGEGISNAAQKAQAGMAAKLAGEQVAQTRSQTELNKAQEDATKAGEIYTKQQTVTSAEQAAKLAVERAYVEQSTKNAAITAGILGNQSGLTARQLHDAQRWGASVPGDTAATLERAAERGLRVLKERLNQVSTPTSAVQQHMRKGPAPLPTWLSSDNPVVQERIRRNRERNK